MHIGGVLLLVALCVGADTDGPAPTPLALPAATEQALPAPLVPRPVTPATPVPPPAVTPPPVVLPDAPAPPPSGVVSGATPPAVLGNALFSADQTSHPKLVWGVVDAKLFPDAGRMAPNAEPYNPLFSLDGTINIWLWPAHGLYLFGDSRFWGQRGTPGQTHGNFDYTKREFDITVGFAWNYYGFLELRGFAYGYNNLNRGISPIIPEGYNDGTAIEQRWYLSNEYARLGQDGFNISRATFVSIGCYPSKTMTGVDGQYFTPSLFARAYLIWEIPSTASYVFGDFQLICERGPLRPKLFLPDVGVAIVPFETLRMLEFRIGSEFQADVSGGGDWRINCLPYLSVRLNY